MARSAALFLILGLTGAPALGQETPAARVQAGVWSAPDRGQFDGVGRLGLDLSEAISLDATWARPLESPGSGLLTGRVQLGEFRVAGGALGHDAGMHLGYAPRFEGSLGGGFHLLGQLDAAVGAGRLESTTNARSWFPAGVDLLAVALGGGLELSWRRSALELLAGLSVDVVAVAAPPGASEEGLLSGTARLTHLGSSSALSRAAVGGYGEARLRLLEWRRGAKGLRLMARYREAWDWIHLDTVYTVLQRQGTLAGVRLEPVPPRVTRIMGLTLGIALGETSLRIDSDLRHVLDSTTMEDFADRPGWSVGGAVDLSWRACSLGIGWRYQLRNDPRTALLGVQPRFALTGQLRLGLVRESGLHLDLVGGVQVGLADSWGIPRAGTAWRAGIEVGFGGPRPRVDYQPFPRPSGPDGVAPLGDYVAPPRPSSDPSAPLDREQIGALIELLPAEFQSEASEALARVELPTAAQVSSWLDAHPQAVARVERELPGLVDSVRSLLETSAADAPLGAPTLVAGYGRGGMKLSLVQRRRASLYAVTTRLEGRASDFADTRRVVDTPEARRTVSGSHSDLAGLLAAHRLDQVSVLDLRGGRGKLSLQLDSSWARVMRHLLTGR